MTLTKIEDLDRYFDYGDALAPEITELSFARTGGSTWLFAHTTDVNTAFITIELTNAGTFEVGTFVEGFGDGTYDPFDQDDPSGFSALTVDGTFYIAASHDIDFPAGADNHGLHFYTVDGAGALTLASYFARPALAQQEIKSLQVDGETLVFEISTDANGTYRDLNVLSMSSSFGLSFFQTAFRPESFSAAQVNAVGDVDGDAYFFYTRADNQNIAWISVTSSGFGLFQGQIFGSGEGGEAAVATDMELVSVEGESYLITSSQDEGLQSFDVNSISSMSRVDVASNGSVLNGWNASEIASFDYKGRAFIVSAGPDLTVFEVTNEGEFFLSAQVDNARGLTVNDVEVQVTGEDIRIVGAGTNGLTSYDFDPGPAQDRVGTGENDVMTGDSRDNVFSGYRGNDRLFGETGHDTLFGNQGNDRLFGGVGNDDLRGAEGKDALFGGKGDDDLEGGSGRDVVAGAAGRDDLWGDGGNDRLDGGTGGDDLYGGNGKDRLIGGKDADDLSGGGGADLLIGGRGADKLLGGSKADTFVFAADGSVDRVLDWQSIDAIELRGFSDAAAFRDIDVIEKNDGSLRLKLEDETLMVFGARDLEVRDVSRDQIDFA